MLFLVEFDRREGRIIKFIRFGELDRDKAETERLELELELHRTGVGGHEVVVLEAASEEALHKTHRRYFGGVGYIIKSSEAGG